MAGVCGEVLTIQLGHYANFLGTHWWNLQEAEFTQRSARRSGDPEICSDVLFRRGMTLQGVETYTPRLIVLDIKGSRRSVREEGWLYEDRVMMHDTPAWTGNLTIHKEAGVPVTDPRMEEGETLTARDTVSRGTPAPSISQEMPERGEIEDIWSDYLQAQLHPKSLCVLSGHGGGGLETFSQGESLCAASGQLDEVEDRLHFFTEECDYLQGFQILCDINNGFAGAASKMAELLHDEYPGRGIFSFGTSDLPTGERDPQQSMYQLMNCVLALVALSSHSSALCPLSVSSSLGRRPGPPTTFPYLLYNAGRQCHSSAVLALALDTLTSPYRMLTPSMSMLHLAESLNFRGRKVLAASCSTPFPLTSSASLPEALHPYLSSPPWRSVSACADGGEVFSQSVVLRGIPWERQTCASPGPVPFVSCASGAEVLQHYLSIVYPRSLSTSQLLQTPCIPGAAFPSIFSPYVTRDGYIAEEPQGAVVGRVPVMVALQASSHLQRSLGGLCDELGRVDCRRWVNAEASGVEHEQVKEALEELRCLSHCYRTREEETDDSD